MTGAKIRSGDWMLMANGYAWGVYSDQGGPRGSEKAFVQSMAMLDASRPLGDGAGLQLRAMASLDPLMGQRGYPILFASGATANGEPLIARQHPHDFLMETSPRLGSDLGGTASAVLSPGLPGEPPPD